MSHAARKQWTGVTVDIECLDCHAQKSEELSADKFKALSESWKIQEPCGTCGRVTEWSFAQAAVNETEQEDFWDWMATTGEYFEPEGAIQQDERRQERRVEMRVPLRISVGSDSEESVSSENISKTGFCFSSGHSYQVGQSLRVTLQMPGATDAVTRMGTIVRAGAGAEGKPVYGVRLES